MSVTVEQFIRALYARTPPGLLELRPRPPKEGYAQTSRQWLPISNGKLAASDVKLLHGYIADAEATGENAFFGLATRREAGDGTASNLLALPALYVDFDHRRSRRRREYAVREIKWGPPPSFLVASGGGWHGYWLLDRPLDVSTSEGVAEAKVAVGRLAAYFSNVACTGALDVTRCLRLLGSVNPRYSPPPRATLELYEPTHVWPLEMLMAWCPREPLKARRTAVGRSGQTIIVDDHAFRQLRRAYCRRFDPADMLGLPIAIPDGTRHGTFVSLAGLLQDGERDADEMTTWLEALWAEYCSRDPRRGEIEGIVEYAMKLAPFAPAHRPLARVSP
jgi:hypothetical protein